MVQEFQIGGTRKLSENSLAARFSFSRVGPDTDKDSISYRTPLAIAMLSVAFEGWVEDLARGWKSEGANGVSADLVIDGLDTGLIFCAAVLCLFPRSSRLGVAVFILGAALVVWPEWQMMANHAWLAL